MSWRTRGIAAALVAALVLAGLLVPRVPGLLYVHRIPWESLTFEWGWAGSGQIGVGNSRSLAWIDLPANVTLWWLVALEELVLVVLGGLALAWSLRRDRRARSLNAER